MIDQALDPKVLIEAVAAEVMKRLQQAPAIELMEGKKIALLLTSERSPALESVLNRHFEVQYYDESVRDCDLLIIPMMCIQLLANLGNAISAGARERFVLTMLLKGKRVIALEEGLIYRKYKQTSSKMLYKQYDDFVTKLQNYGIRIVRESELLNVSLEDGRPSEFQETTLSKTASIETASQPELLNRKLITEAEVKKCHLQNVNEIVVGRHAIITPLAQDYMRLMKMSVLRR